MSLLNEPPVFCKHLRTADTCEDCAHAAALERGHLIFGETPKTEKPATVFAGEDMCIDRGEGVYTQVLAGEQIPPDLVNFPRVSRTG